MLIRNWLRNLAVAWSTVFVSTAFAQSDSCLTATDLTNGAVAGTFVGATIDGSATCGDSTPQPDVWFKYAAPANGRLWLSTCGSQANTTISVHSDCPGTPANEILCNDESGPCDPNTIVAFNVTQGQTYYIRLTCWHQSGSSFILDSKIMVGGADIYAADLTECRQVARQGSTVGLMIDAPMCNMGGTPVNWYAIPDNRHPFFNFNMYRLENDRLTQIGQSWTKHADGSAQQPLCTGYIGCDPWPNYQRLGVGCSDAYGALINADQSRLGPRSEINPHTGAYTFAGSYLADPNPPVLTPISHQLRVEDADLSATAHPNAQYFVEFHSTAADDSNLSNSIVNSMVNRSGNPGGTWQFSLTGASVRQPAIFRWPGANLTQIPETPTDDGVCRLAAKVIDLGNGHYRYEYALYNERMDRGVKQFAIPVGVATNITNIGFSGVRSHDEPFHNNPWTAARDGALLVFSTDDFSPTSNSNPLRWGTMFNFWFETSTAPTTSKGLIWMYKPGLPDRFEGEMLAPLSLCPADLDNGSGLGIPDEGVTLDDLLYYLVKFEGGDTAADLDDGTMTGTHDGGVGIDDLLYFLTRFEAGC